MTNIIVKFYLFQIPMPPPAHILMWSMKSVNKLMSSEIYLLFNQHVQYKSETGKACFLVETINFTTRGATKHPLPSPRTTNRQTLASIYRTRRELRWASDSANQPFSAREKCFALSLPSPLAMSFTGINE